MPFAQLRELVVECDRLAEGTIDDSAEPPGEPTIDQLAYRLTVTATNDRGDCAFVVDSPAQPTSALDKTAQDGSAFTRTDNRTDHRAVHAAEGAATGALDAIDIEIDTDDTVDDFEAQPTAYRVRTQGLDAVLASSPPR